MLFSLLRATNYHYNKGPIIVENITILMICVGLLCIIFLQSISLRWVINIVFIYIYDIFLKMEKRTILYWTTIINIFLSFSDWNILHHFSPKYRIYTFFVFSVIFFEAAKEIHKFSSLVSIYINTLNFLFVGY